MRSTRNYLDSFVNHTSDAIHVEDLNGKVLQMNSAFEKMYGWSADEILGKPLSNIPDQLEQEYEKILRSIYQHESITDYETVRYTKSGHHIDVSITISPIRDDKDEVVAIASITRNITARKQSEEALLQSEKLSAIGQLAAGVAHEIRNPLTTLKGFVQLQQKGISVKEDNLKVMLSELDRINLIVSEFLFLAKPQASNFQTVDIKAILEDIGVFLQPQAILHNILFTMTFPAELPPVYGEMNQLKQVFINVLKNAMEAMPSGGTVRIELLTETPKHNIVRIIDHGCGIPQEALNRLGDPFFTSKENGTGLGLMVSKRIITNHKGTISFESKPGQGSTVDIRLPTAH
ncbi:ATP-binding protein [Paenibacillus sp. V4I7]|uniref:ATP-binding protein n=1 Tax=Paenibacillus sp. V4I7 TaxID=3042307 RepID=UPI00278723C7|nr:ATP-binding protein [Paenibacillus sp. V4I7]MDQ0896805.1 PAS domain S-box-containing protein [Paenibacillus sp. V4I7]